MLIVVSPAKSLDYESPLPTKKFTQPAFLEQSAELVAVMAKKSPAEIEKLMSISPGLAALNHGRFHDWEPRFTAKNSRQAVLAFNGDVYGGMAARTTFTHDDFLHAQKTLRILSGLYGVLRPLDRMMPYRLEMGSKLRTHRGKDLYAYWGNTITDAIALDVRRSPGERVLVNLASNEYFGAVRPARLGVPVVSPAFLDADGAGTHRVVSFFAKRARGVMTAWIIRERVAKREQLHEFCGMGYRFDTARSTVDRPVFVRGGGS